MSVTSELTLAQRLEALSPADTVLRAETLSVRAALSVAEAAIDAVEADVSDLQSATSGVPTLTATVADLVNQCDHILSGVIPDIAAESVADGIRRFTLPDLPTGGSWRVVGFEAKVVGNGSAGNTIFALALASLLGTDLGTVTIAHDATDDTYVASTNFDSRLSYAPGAVVALNLNAKATDVSGAGAVRLVLRPVVEQVWPVYPVA